MQLLEGINKVMQKSSLGLKMYKVMQKLSRYLTVIFIGAGVFVIFRAK